MIIWHKKLYEQEEIWLNLVRSNINTGLADPCSVAVGFRLKNFSMDVALWLILYSQWPIAWEEQRFPPQGPIKYHIITNSTTSNGDDLEQQWIIPQREILSPTSTKISEKQWNLPQDQLRCDLLLPRLLSHVQVSPLPLKKPWADVSASWLVKPQHLQGSQTTGKTSTVTSFLCRWRQLHRVSCAPGSIYERHTVSFLFRSCIAAQSSLKHTCVWAKTLWKM